MPKEEVKIKGVYEKASGSGDWWIRYADASGRIRREKAGAKNVAVKLVAKRRTEILQGKKLPESLRQRVVRFSEIADDAIAYVEKTNAGAVHDVNRINTFKEAFGEMPAELPVEELRKWFHGKEWEPGTFNRNRTVLSGVFRLAIENGKIKVNPARMLKRLREPDGRVRFLNQFPPLKTDLNYLKQHKTEEARLRAVIAKHYAKHTEEFDIALNTGMRRSEQYERIDWPSVDLKRSNLTIPQSKNGQARHIPLNSTAHAAFKRLQKRTLEEGPIFLARNGDALVKPRHWYEDAVAEAGIRHFTWHDMRHTFASRLVMAGVDLRTVAELLGHKRIQMTMRYAHLAPQHKLDAVEKLVAYRDHAAHHAPARATDTRTDTNENRHSENAVAKRNKPFAIIALPLSVGQ